LQEPVQAATGLQSILLPSQSTQSGPAMQLLVPEQETPKGGAWQVWLAVQLAESEVAPQRTKRSERTRTQNVLRMTHLLAWPHGRSPGIEAAANHLDLLKSQVRERSPA
jgi:hypothetical protein